MRQSQMSTNLHRWHSGLVCTAIACALLMIPRLAESQATPGQNVSGEIQKYLPEHATITQQTSVNFGNGIEPGAVAVVYTLPPVYAGSYDLGLRILRRKGASEWAVAYQETQDIGPGQDEVTLQKAKAASGQEGLVVVYYHSGAGTTTDWKLIAAKSGKFVSFNPRPIREKVLKQRRQWFGGYNGVNSDGDIVTETIAGYSEHQARCCPDKPEIAMRIRFTGTAIKLDGVSELPDRGGK